MMGRPDARLFQIACLGTLLGVNMLWFDFGARPVQSAVTITATLLAQAACARLARQRFEPYSALITGLSLSLLLRANDPAVWAAAAVLAIASKFALRVRGKHVFNPAAFGIAVSLLLTDAWVSPGQWGADTWLVLLLVSLGGLVLFRSERLDTAVGFLLCYGGLLAWRCLVLGDPWVIPLHQVQTGSLLLFAFFMVTDPRSTPDSRAGRMLFVAAVAALGYHLQFVWQLRTGLYFALLGVSLFTPIIDALLPAARFHWRAKEA